MRPIKFRAWDGKNMVEPSKNFMIDSHSGFAFWSFGFELNIQPDWVIMQFTGLLDKNGKEIYEGDIVKHLTVPHYYESLSIGAIEWDKWRAQFRHSNYSEEYLSGKDVEVIGNIYEDLELLEES